MAENKEKIKIELTAGELSLIVSSLMLEKQTLEFLRGFGAMTERERKIAGLTDRLLNEGQKSDFNAVCR